MMEAKELDWMAGYHRFHSEETREPYGSFEVFFVDTGELAGWYWQACSPGCLPDGEASGPFESSDLAHEDADEWSPQYDI